MAHRSPPLPGAPPRHGGALIAATRAHGIPLPDWLDLSTGINPVPYPAPPFERDDLARLPDPDRLAALTDAARLAYGLPETAAILAVPGTDLAIRLLPLLFPKDRVAILSPTYSGHGEGWASAGHEIVPVSSLDEAFAAAPVIVLANPNNPDGRQHAPDELRAALDPATARPALVVDEAFCDLVPELSLVPKLPPRAIVLRSFGKFYGLAGLRLGFVIGPKEAVEGLRQFLGDWPVSGPALAAGAAALADQAWQQETRLRLSADRARLDAMLRPHGFDAIEGTDLFRTVRTSLAGRLHAELARQGIWTRIFGEAADRIRIGLPPPGEFERLEQALAEAAARLSEGRA